MNNVNRLIFILLIATTLFTATASGEILRLNLQKGDRYLMHSNINVVTTVETPDKKMELRMTMAPDIAFYVIRETADGYEMGLSYERFILSVVTPLVGKDIAIDTDSITYKDSLSENTTQEGLLKQFGVMLKLMTGRSLSISVSKSGKVLNIGDFSAIMKPAAEYLSRQLAQSKLPADSIAKIKTKQTKLLKQADPKASFEKSFIVFPDQSVKAGNTWENVSSLNGDTLHKVINTWRLVSITDDEYVIESVSKFAPNAPTDGFLGMLFKTEIGDNNSQYHLDRKSGWIKSAEGKMLMTISMPGSMDSKPNGGVSSGEGNTGMKMSVQTDFTITQ